MDKIATEDLDSDQIVEQLIRQFDETTLPLPDFDGTPHLLISKVRKHYMEYIIKLLSDNYETNQKLLNKNIYLPSAIWRCAKDIETTAARMCMVVQLYRKNMGSVVTQLKNDTKNGKLNKKLFECLRTPPINDKKNQTIAFEESCNCECNCKRKKRRRQASAELKITCSQTSESPKTSDFSKQIDSFRIENENPSTINSIPVLINSQVQYTENALDAKKLPRTQTSDINVAQNIKQKKVAVEPFQRISVDSQESDELMMQLEKLFHHDPNDEDLFEGCWEEPSVQEDHIVKSQNVKFDNSQTDASESVHNNKDININFEVHAKQIKSLDERLASIAGLLANNVENNEQNNFVQPKPQPVRHRRSNSKWMCEEYFLKSKLFEILIDIGDSKRQKLARIKEMMVKLFGEDSDDEGVLSPVEETPAFASSCKERVAPFVVKSLTPYYTKGRIIGKAIFKLLAKHLIKLIYQCSRYPSEYEVQSFIKDFMKTHKVIDSEKSFTAFGIENLVV